MSSVSPRTNGASVSNDFCYIKPLCSPLLCVTIHQSSDLKRYHSKLLKTHKLLMESFSVRQLPSFGGVGGGPSYEISLHIIT